MKTKPKLQNILRGILHMKDENEHSHERRGIITFQEKSSQTTIE
jgi:hypothetical protein